MMFDKPEMLVAPFVNAAGFAAQEPFNCGDGICTFVTSTQTVQVPAAADTGGPSVLAMPIPVTLIDD